MKSLKLLLLEDNENDCAWFKNSAEERDDVNLVGIYNSVDETIKHINCDNIDGVILDLELTRGSGGSGLIFLQKLNELNLDKRPLIIVTTNNLDENMHQTVRDFGITMLFSKIQDNYSPEVIFNHFVMINNSKIKRTTNESRESAIFETRKSKENWLKLKIDSELDLFGIPYKNDGRKYFFDAIYYLLTCENEDKYFLAYLTNKYKTSDSNISNAMQTAINRGWKDTPPDELEKNYTARIDPNKGVPRPTEFVHHILMRIKKSMKDF